MDAYYSLNRIITSTSLVNKLFNIGHTCADAMVPYQFAIFVSNIKYGDIKKKIGNVSVPIKGYSVKFQKPVLFLNKFVKIESFQVCHLEEAPFMHQYLKEFVDVGDHSNTLLGWDMRLGLKSDMKYVLDFDYSNCDDKTVFLRNSNSVTCCVLTNGTVHLSTKNKLIFNAYCDEAYGFSLTKKYNTKINKSEEKALLASIKQRKTAHYIKIGMFYSMKNNALGFVELCKRTLNNVPFVKVQGFMNACNFNDETKAKITEELSEYYGDHKTESPNEQNTASKNDENEESVEEDED